MKIGAMKPRPLYLGGEWRHTESTVRIVNPSDGEAFAEVCTVGRDEVAQAVAQAHAALPAWRALPGKARGEFLRKVADQVERRADEIARVITQENGKPLPQSQAETAMAVDHLRWFAEEARRAYGRTIPHQVDGKRHLVVKTPIGVVAAIGPWNFPLVLGVRKVAPALAAGCPVILKPASATPVSTLVFAECVEAAGLPRGVFHVAVGRAAEIAAEFLENPRVRKISFTGSTEVGRELIRGAAASVKPLSLELGGLAPVLVFADADLSRAVAGTAIAKFRNTGQSCIAANRIYVQRPIYAEFLEEFVAHVRGLKTGDGFEPGVQVGPLINEAALRGALGHIAEAQRLGARLLAGGGRLERKGWFLEPTVLADVPPGAACVREEVFAPVAAIAAFDTEEEAVALANGAPYGLSAYAFTRDLSRGFRLMENLESGMLGLNDSVPTTSQAPFGGVKQSGWGRELGTEGLEAFLETKHVSIAL